MSKYVKATEVADAITEKLGLSPAVVVDIMAELKGVDIVECKDCKFYTSNINKSKEYPNYRNGYCAIRDVGDFCKRNPNEFCSRGERIEEDGTDI